MNTSQLQPPPDVSQWIVKLSDHYCDGGGYGDVWKCLYNRNSASKEVAVKALRFQFMLASKESNGDDKYIRLARRELGIWRRLNHKNIVPFLGIAYGFGPHVALVSLWMPHGTLRAFLAAHDDKLAIYHKLQLLLDVADGLLYLHSQPFVHGDLTSNNVLIDEAYRARLADFGLASLVGEIPEGLTYLHASTMRTGTVRWAAPEHFSQDADKAFQRTTKTDIYSFGHIVFEVLSGMEPWSEIREDFRVVLSLSQGQRPARPLFSPIDDRYWDLIDNCWRPADERPTANDVVVVLRNFLDSCPTRIPLHDVLRSPRITLHDIVPQNQESTVEQGQDRYNSREDHPDDPAIPSRAHPAETLIAERVAKLQIVSERRKALLRETYRMLQGRDNPGSVLAIDEVGNEDENDGLRQFMARFDLTKSPESTILSDLPDSELFVHSLLSPSEGFAKEVGGLTKLDAGYPMSGPSAHLNIVKQKDEEDAIMNDVTETRVEVGSPTPSPRQPQTPWAPLTTTFAHPSQTASIPAVPPTFQPVTFDSISNNPHSFGSAMSHDYVGFPPAGLNSVGYPIFSPAMEYPPSRWPPYHGLPSTGISPAQESPCSYSHRTTQIPACGPERGWWFAEGPDYGPVLEPFLAKVVKASININPLLTPPSPSHEDYLRWNMLFNTGNCYRTFEILRPWRRGRKEPATHPRLTRIWLVSRAFPWTIHVCAENPKTGVTCEDVLNAISVYMHSDAAKDEYDKLPHPRKGEISASYTFNRSSNGSVPGKRLGGAMKRIDWLDRATRFGGLVMDEGFVREQCGDLMPCTFELRCLTEYALTAAERGEVPLES